VAGIRTFETWRAGPGFAFGFAVTVFVQTGFERKLVGRPGLEPADGSDLWFKARPKEEPMNHSLVAVRHRARRARVTRDHRIKSPRPASLKSLIINIFRCT